MADAADKIESGEWVVPKLHSAMGGNAWDISKPRKGYDDQPDQSTLKLTLANFQKASIIL
jgi:hypothetical protein